MATTWRRRMRYVAVVGAIGSLLLAGQAMAAPGGNGWTSAGGDRQNTRSQASESKISPATVGNLTERWHLVTGGDVSATPAVDGQRVYAPDWAGNLYAVDRRSGSVDWQRTISSYTGVPNDKARVTPAVTQDSLVLGNQGPFGGGGMVFAVDKNTGDLLWKTQLDDHPAAIITQSATVFDGVVYVGTASQEELLSAVVPGYDCCTFRGAVAALDLETGKLLWKTLMTPADYPGNAVWGSSPAIDTKCGSVYVATGNNYDAPPEALVCVDAATTTGQKQACLPADNHFDSILSLDMRTGAVKWPPAPSTSTRGRWTASPSSATARTAPSRPARTSTSVRRPRCTRSRAAPPRAASSSAPARRAASTGRSTPTPARRSGSPRPGPVGPPEASSGARRSTAGGSTRPTPTATASRGPVPEERPRGSGAPSTPERAS